MKNKPYAQLSTIEKEFKFQVHLINPTANNYSRVVMETGAYLFFDDDKPITTSVVKKELGSLPTNSTLLADESDLGERDFTIWYNFDLYRTEDDAPERISNSLVPYKNYFTK